MKRLRKSEDGLTLIEILVATAIFALIIVAYLTFFSNTLVFTKKTDDRRLAVQKAMMMMEEVRAFVESGSETQVDLLDDFDDAENFNPILTLERGVSAPGDALSGNIPWEKGWKYYRRVTVKKISENEKSDVKDLRHVTISVFQSETGEPGGGIKAELSGVFRTLSAPFPPTQVMDTYILALENVPGWWVNMTTLRPLVEQAFSDLESANPGLKFRNHWITRLSYGRDRLYRPQINSLEIASKGLDMAYFYPGRINRQGFWYYSPDLMRGQVSVDGQIQNFEAKPDDNDLTQYALADQFNHGMRYLDELRIYEKRKKVGFDPEPSLRFLLDDMNMRPERYRNALVVNLHGELLPLPPIRNYSDAARSPRKSPGARVVTHAENLVYEAHQPVKLRVYPFAEDPDRKGAGATIDEGVSILLRDMQDVGPLKIQMIAGGADAYRLIELETDKVAQRVNQGVLISLKDVPIRHPGRGGQGLNAGDRLYGLEYIPSPVEAENNFSRNLLDNGNVPKNTARYIITIPSFALPRSPVLTVETRIGAENVASGALENEPENLSRTYVWINSQPPPSEQFQFLGDPRHMPYADVKARHGYNWHLKKIEEGSGYGGFTHTEDGWSTESVDLDVPRYFQMFRNALLRTNSVFTTMTGFSFYYVGIGGEIGSDRPNGFPDGLPVGGKVYGEDGVKMVRAITEGVENVRASTGDWMAIPWIGELYPDEMLPTWQRLGNLPAGRGPQRFYRAPWSEMPAAGKLPDRRRRTEVWGSASFFNAIGEGKGPFNHLFSSDNVAIAGKNGEELEDTFHFPIEAKLKAIRPFTLDSGTSFPPEWNQEAYQRDRSKLRVMETFYTASQPRGSYSSAVLHLRGPQGTEGAYFVVNGLSPAGETGTNYIGRYALLTLLQSFLRGGTNDISVYRIPQMPLVRITRPKESADLLKVDRVFVTWDTQFRRWDGEPYTTDPGDAAARESAVLDYAMKYSPDDGRTWLYVQDNQPAPLGEAPNETYRLSGAEYDWYVGDKEGNYLVRLEAYRREIPMHYSFHQVSLSLKR